MQLIEQVGKHVLRATVMSYPGIVVPPNYDPVNAYAEAEATEALPKLSKPIQYLNFEEIREYVGKI